jgi:hypothetical protein
MTSSASLRPGKGAKAKAARLGWKNSFVAKTTMSNPQLNLSEFLRRFVAA